MVDFGHHIKSNASTVRVLLESTVTNWPAVTSWPPDEKDFSKIPVTIEGYEIGKPRYGKVSTSDEYDLVIFCSGVGSEVRTLKAIDETEESRKQFGSYAFWDKYDPLFDFDSAATSKQFSQKLVVIGGGGDGALGDFIALLTGKRFLGDVLQAIPFEESELGKIHQLRLLIDSYQQLGEDIDDSILRRLQAEVCGLELEVWNRAGVKERIAKLLRPERPYVQIAMTNFHFAFSNIANRISAQLLARLLVYQGSGAQNGGLVPFRIGVKLSRVKSTDATHQCMR